MPRRTDLNSILIIGAGPIVIGQACEFDYSGVQACKALRQEGFRVILVNSNPATIMTDPEMADAVYIEPVNWQTVARIIERERPDALLPTMGWGEAQVERRQGGPAHLPNPITLFSLFPFPECSAFTARTISISRSSIACVIFHFAGSASALPA